MSAEGHNTRLHISPLDQTLLDAILHGKPAQEISFHSIPTFPENNYGFITLPNEDAQKIMKKLNGAILRGRKLRIQPARPRYTVNHDDGGASNRSTATTTPSTSNTPTDVSRKRRLTDNVVLGDLLPQKRHIKRAWTEPIMKRKSALPAGVKNPQRSKYTDKRECLFRIKLPPNKLDAMDKEVAKPTPQTKSKRSGPIREVTVHEFAKTYKHPSFIRSDAAVVDSALTHLFDDAVGWLDRLGHVKEPINENLRRHTYIPPIPPTDPVQEDDFYHFETESETYSSDDLGHENHEDTTEKSTDIKMSHDDDDDDNE